MGRVSGALVIYVKSGSQFFEFLELKTGPGLGAKLALEILGDF